jgi:hypothetical protein
MDRLVRIRTTTCSHPSHANSRLLTAQLVGRRSEPLVQRPGSLLRKRPVQLLALFRERQIELPALCRDGAVQVSVLLRERQVQVLTLFFSVSLVSVLVARYPRYCTNMVTARVSTLTAAG